MQPQEVRIMQGSDTRVVIPIDPGGASVDFWTAHAQIRPTVDSGTVLADFSTGDSTIEITATQVAVLIPAAVSAAWAWSEGVWDVELTIPSQGTQRIAQGRFILDREVTR